MPINVNDMLLTALTKLFNSAWQAFEMAVTSDWQEYEKAALMCDLLQGFEILVVWQVTKPQMEMEK